MTEREQMLQQQLLQERQQFEAALRASQAQPQPQPPISSLGLPPKVGDDVDINVRRSASTKRARPENQTTDKTKRARSASTSHRSPSPKRDYPRGTCTATRPAEASPKRAEHTLTPAQVFGYSIETVFQRPEFESWWRYMFFTSIKSCFQLEDTLASGSRRSLN